MTEQEYLEYMRRMREKEIASSAVKDMNTFLITYNLRRPDRNYPRISEAIQNLGVWCHLMQSVWLVKTNSTPEIIRNHLIHYMDLDDTLLVTELLGISAWSGFSLIDTNWLISKSLLVSRNG